MSASKYGFLVLFLFFFTSSTYSNVVIKGATIVDGLGGTPIENGIIVIEGNRIASIGDENTDYPADTPTISAYGKYIIPGMMDANMHHILEFSIETLARYEGHYDSLILEASQIALKQGLTTVFDTWGPLPNLINVRNAINSGDKQGARIYLAGNIIGYDGPLSSDFLPGSSAVLSHAFLKRVNDRWEQGVGKNLLWMPPEKLRAQLLAYFSKDIDFVKYAASGHAFGEMQYITFSAAAQDLIVNEARHKGLIVQTHTTSVGSLRMAIDAGVNILQHCDETGPEPIPKDLLERLKNSDIYCATLSRTNKRIEEITSSARGEAEKAYFDSFSIRNTNTRNMISHGIKILLSTDASVFSADAESHPFFSKYAGSHEDSLIQLGEGHFNWLKAVVEKGMPPMEALASATINIARAYQVDDKLGSLEKGKIADLVILNKNPLENVEFYRDIHLVMKEGVVINRDVLPESRFLSEK